MIILFTVKFRNVTYNGTTIERGHNNLRIKTAVFNYRDFGMKQGEALCLQTAKHCGRAQ